MLLFRVVPTAIFLLALAWTARADKKIELQDIEEDNLKSEKEKEHQTSEPRSQNVIDPGRDLLPLEFLKNGLLRYFESPQVPQQPRYVHQYAVNEPPEKPIEAPKPQYGTPTASQAMVGYLSNVPMQIYLIPQQYYGHQTEQASNSEQGVQYAPAVARVAAYPTAPEVVQPQHNYIDVPGYVTPSGKAYVSPQYTPQITYVTYSPQPTTAPSNAHMTVFNGVQGPTGSQTTIAPLLYSMPLIQYPSSLASQTIYSKPYYPGYSQHTETNTIEDIPERELENPKQYATQTEAPYTKTTSPEFPRYYTSRAPLREDHRHHPVPELPPPAPILLRSQPPHLAGIPKALPLYRPISKPVYSAPGNLIPRPGDVYGFPKKRPTSLLDSYIPSSVQLEYLKRGYAKDPLSVYDALSSGRSFSHHPVTPRYYERGFLPNQMYHTAAGGITYGHYKRTPKIDKTNHK